jgi:hypothetical protein
MRFEIVNSNFATFCDETASLQVREKNRKPENALNNRKKVQKVQNPFWNRKLEICEKLREKRGLRLFGLRLKQVSLPYEKARCHPEVS